MHCPNRISHIVQQGDTLPQLAQNYQTTIASIMSLNPRLNPYELQIGSSITVCPGDSLQTRLNASRGATPNMDAATATNAAPVMTNAGSRLALSNQMRESWEQHVYWTRMLLISIADRLDDQAAVTERLLQNPQDTAEIFSAYYPPEITQTIARLLTEHLQIGAALITALRDGQRTEAEILRRQWYANANQMAEAFSGINPHYGREELRQMLYQHLDLTILEISERLAGNYPADISAFNRVEAEALRMADFFTAGLIKQFPQKFSA